MSLLLLYSTFQTMSNICSEKTEKIYFDCDANNANANKQRTKITMSQVVCNLLPKCLHNVTLWRDRVAFFACLPEHKTLKLPPRYETWTSVFVKWNNFLHISHNIYLTSYVKEKIFWASKFMFLTGRVGSVVIFPSCRVVDIGYFLHSLKDFCHSGYIFCFE